MERKFDSVGSSKVVGNIQFKTNDKSSSPLSVVNKLVSIWVNVATTLIGIATVIRIVVDLKEGFTSTMKNNNRKH